MALPTLKSAESAHITDANLPRHIAIIMDGNGRWAADRNLPRVDGHREGAHAVRDVVRAARELGIQALTLYAFSEQNWERPSDEVGALMELLYRYVLEERAEILDNQIRLTTIGQIHRLPEYVQQALNALMQASAHNGGMTLCLALSYGAHEDMVRCMQRLAAQVKDGQLQPDQIDESIITRHLTTADLPPLDLLIRTSGEYRISNFLLWEAAYAELYFSSLLWPEFRRQQLYEAIAVYQRRERRFGRTSEQLKSNNLTIIS